MFVIELDIANIGLTLLYRKSYGSKIYLESYVRYVWQHVKLSSTFVVTGTIRVRISENKQIAVSPDDIVGW